MKLNTVERVSVLDLKEGDWFYQVSINKVTRKLKFEPSKHRDNAKYMNQLQAIGVYLVIKTKSKAAATTKSKSKPKQKPVQNLTLF